MTTTGREDETRQRLLAAAGEIFSCKGFQAATVREITRLAKVNLAAIHYHFGSKDRLYQAVLEYGHHEANRRYPPDMGLTDPDAPPETRLYASIRALFLRLADTERHAWLHRLMAREMGEPSSNLNALVERCLAPANAVLRNIVEILLGPEATPRTVARYTQSVVGQCRHFALEQPVITRLYPDCDPTEGGIDALAEHVTRFSLAAMCAWKNRDWQVPLLDGPRGQDAAPHQAGCDNTSAST